MLKLSEKRRNEIPTEVQATNLWLGGESNRAPGHKDPRRRAHYASRCPLPTPLRWPLRDPDKISRARDACLPHAAVLLHPPWPKLLPSATRTRTPAAAMPQQVFLLRFWYWAYLLGITSTDCGLARLTSPSYDRLRATAHRTLRRSDLLLWASRPLWPRWHGPVDADGARLPYRHGAHKRQSFNESVGHRA